MMWWEIRGTCTHFYSHNTCTNKSINGPRMLDFGKYSPEAEFLDVNGTEVYRVFLLTIHSYSTPAFTPPPLLSKSGLKLVCNVNIVYGSHKSENSQYYTQKPQQNCTFMNSTSRNSAYVSCMMEARGLE